MMREAKPGLYEYHLEARFLHHCYANGGCRRAARGLEAPCPCSCTGGRPAQGGGGRRLLWRRCACRCCPEPRAALRGLPGAMVSLRPCVQDVRLHTHLRLGSQRRRAALWPHGRAQRCAPWASLPRKSAPPRTSPAALCVPHVLGPCCCCADRQLQQTDLMLVDMGCEYYRWVTLAHLEDILFHPWARAPPGHRDVLPSLSLCPRTPVGGAGTRATSHALGPCRASSRRSRRSCTTPCWARTRPCWPRSSRASSGQ